MSQDGDPRSVQIIGDSIGPSRLQWRETIRADGSSALTPRSVSFQNDKSAAARARAQQLAIGDSLASSCEDRLRSVLAHQFGITRHGISSAGPVLDLQLSMGMEIDNTAYKPDHHEEDFADAVKGFNMKVRDGWVTEGLENESFNFQAYDDRTSFAELFKDDPELDGSECVESARKWIGKHRIAADVIARHVENHILDLQKHPKYSGWPLGSKSAVETGCDAVKYAVEDFLVDVDDLLDAIEQEGKKSGRSCHAACEALARFVAGDEGVAIQQFSTPAIEAEASGGESSDIESSDEESSDATGEDW